MLPALRVMRGARCLPCLWGPPLLWAVLLLAAEAAEAGTAELSKAVVTLDPPWINVVQEDWVTLHCQGPHSPEDHDTRWFHNDSSLGAEGPRSLSFQAASNASGEYRCQTRHSGRSDPVRLAVRAEWLLLQTPALHFREGDPIVLRCHSWRNRPLFKVTFFQDGVAKRFSHGNRNFSIPQANASHSGAYHCQGVIGKTPHTSPPVTITIQQEVPSSQSSPAVIVVAVLATLMVLVVAGAVGWWHRHRKQNSDTGPDAEEAPRKEAEKTITYSLLSHPEGPEEDSPSYQKYI